MANEVRIGLDAVARHFEDLDDPRSTVNRRHPLVSVVVISLMAVLAGADGPTAIARWAALKADLLTRALGLPHGVPCKDVFRRVLSALEPDAFQVCFAGWLDALRQAAVAATGVERELLAIDGKVRRRSHDRRRGLGALHTVSVWASDLGLSLGQVACDEKSNEITAIPELLRLVDVTGAIVTIDAMGGRRGARRGRSPGRSSRRGPTTCRRSRGTRGRCIAQSSPIWRSRSRTTFPTRGRVAT